MDFQAKYKQLMLARGQHYYFRVFGPTALSGYTIYDLDGTPIFTSNPLIRSHREASTEAERLVEVLENAKRQNS